MFDKYMIPFKILNIICSNEGESDELNFIGTNNEKYTIFYDGMLEAMNDEMISNDKLINNKIFTIYRNNEIKCFRIPAANDVINFTLFVLNKSDLYDSEGNQC
jgi:hypothetical protein